MGGLLADLDLAAVGAVALLAALVVLVAVKRKRREFKLHVDALQQQRSANAAHAAASGAASAAAQKRPGAVFGKWTRAEVAQHDKATDLWLIIQDKRTKEHKVYDMTAYVEEHPGGYAILNSAGGDATEGFHGPQHPPTVFDLLPDYCIGTLVDP